MEHKRAKFLIENSNLSDKDKNFLLTHLEMVDNRLNSLAIEIMNLKDHIEYNNALNDKVLTIKEKLSNLDFNKDIQKQINEIFKAIETGNY